MKGNWREEILGKADDYCSAEGIRRATLGARIVNDGNFFENLERGAGCTVDTYLKIKTWFKNNKPKKKRAAASQEVKQ